MASALERRLQTLERKLGTPRAGGVWAPKLDSAKAVKQFFQDPPNPPSCDPRAGWLVCPAISESVWLELAAEGWTIEHELPDLDESDEEHETNSIQKSPV